MRDEFWNMYVDMKHKQAYIKHYDLLLVQTKRFINISLFVFSAGNISWVVLDDSPLNFLPAFLALAAQLLQACVPYLRLFERLIAFKYFKSSMIDLAYNIEKEWRAIDFHHYDDEKINELINDFTNQYKELDKLYLEPLQLPLKKRCQRKAEADCKSHFSYFHDANEVEYERQNKQQQKRSIFSCKKTKIG